MHVWCLCDQDMECWSIRCASNFPKTKYNKLFPTYSSVSPNELSLLSRCSYDFGKIAVLAYIIADHKRKTVRILDKKSETVNKAVYTKCK